MLFPPTRVIPPEVILVVAPAVFPLEICKELNPGKAAWIEITPAPLLETVTFAPPETVIGPDERDPAAPIDCT
jgi:hypothetical protein